MVNQQNKLGKITVLTAPVSVAGNFRHRARNIARFGKNFLSGRAGFDFESIKFGGHTAVTRSLIEGLRKIGADFNYNPVSVLEVGETVVLLSGIPALQQAVDWKKQGRIKKLLAGPNVMEMPDDFGNILALPEIDAILVPSQMALEIYERLNPQLKGKVKIWYAGVDVEYWKPSVNKKNSNEVLVYWKNAPGKFCVYTENLLKKYGFVPRWIVFGKYTRVQYRKILSKSLFAVFLSITETQGIALAEAWSMGVPTLVWNPKMEHYYIRDLITTSAPYLTPATGVDWKELKELENILENIQKNLPTYKPREWALENMSDEASAKLLIKLLNE